MCSILIFAKPDNAHPDPAQDWTRFKRGDVIDIRDGDNFFWGHDIEGPKSLGWWRVVVLPNTPAADLRSLLDGDSIAEPPAPRRLRVNTIDLDQLEKKAAVKDGKLSSDRDTLLAHRTLKPALQHAAEIGADRRVI